MPRNDAWLWEAIALAGDAVGRVLHGQSEARLKAMFGPHPENLSMDLPCRTVFAAGPRRIEVVGPLLEDEAAVAHHAFW